MNTKVTSQLTPPLPKDNANFLKRSVWLTRDLGCVLVFDWQIFTSEILY